MSQEEFERTRKSGCGGDVWCAGMRVQLRGDWEEVKVRVMYTGNRAKFMQHPKRAARLVASKGAISFSASSSFWCMWNARIMTLLREELKPEGERDEKVIRTIWEQIEAYEKSQRVTKN